ncbi:MAG TPA: hypothetical protein VLA16_18285 [Ideonella sp.]|nr:hypothetical protein [Ideonella sp.]
MNTQLADTPQVASNVADKVAAKADSAINTTRTAANNTLDHLSGTVEHLRQRVPTALTGAAAQIEELKQRSLERARQAKLEVSNRLSQAGERTVGYVRDEPVKSMLIAAGTGAAVAMLIAFLARSRSDDR